jgi:hypothetical protein
VPRRELLRHHTTGACVALKANGASCTLSEECTTGYCNTTSKTCTAEPTVNQQTCGATTPTPTPATGG